MASYKTWVCVVAGWILLAPAFCFGWGVEGHKVVAQIASERLDRNARKAVRALLGKQSLAAVATWPDEVRKQPRYKWSDCLHTAKVAPGFDSFDFRRDCPPEGCAVSAIQYFTGVLRDKTASKDRKIEALKFVVHYVGDVHQPLHVTGKGAGAKANPDVEFFGEHANLHRVWDGSIIQRTQKTWEQYAKELSARITAKQAKDWAGLDPSIWATESYRAACSVVPKEKVLGEDYYKKSLPITDQRLSMGGVRLALLLNYTFAHPTNQPTSMPASAPADR